MKKYILLFALLFSIFISYGQMVVLGSNGNGQQISLVGNTLKLTGSPDVDLSDYLDNTDGQTVTDLSLAGKILSITLSGGNTQTVDLSGITITPQQATDITTNNAKVGITPTQASNITANNAKISNATHTGDVTGSTALTIANNSVTTAKIVDGTIALADLSATGTKNSTTFLRGDNTFGVPLNMGNSDLATSAPRKYTIGSGVSFSFRDFLDAPIFTMNGAGGTPTFSYELAVPTPTLSTGATPKSYVDGINSTLSTAISDNSATLNTYGVTQDSIIVALNTVPASALAIDVKTANYTLVANDAKDNKVLSLDYSNEVATIPSGVFASGNVLKFVYDDAGLGTAHVKQGTGVDIKGFTDGITLNSYPSGVTLARKNTNTAPEVYEVIGIYGSYADYVSAIQLHTQSNAASDPNGNEANATTGWTGQNANLTASSVTPGDTGTYALKGVATASPSYYYYTFSATAGDAFTVSWREKKSVGTTQTVTAWVNCTGGPSFDAVGTSWESESYNITATATGVVGIRFYASNGGNVGDDIFIDNVSILKTN